MYDYLLGIFELFGFSVPTDSLAFEVLVIFALVLAFEFLSNFLYAFCHFVGNLRKV